MVEIGGEGLEQLNDHLAEQSERQAAHVRSLVDEIARRRMDARKRGMNFVAASADKILQRLRGGHTPFIFGLEFNFRTPAPGTLRLLVGIDNPDPVPQFFLYAHFFVGPASLVADTTQALALVDARFPRATEPQFAGLIMDPFSSTTLRFDLPISGRVVESHYLGNVLLIQQTPFDVPGQILDRAAITLKVHN